MAKLPLIVFIFYTYLSAVVNLYLCASICVWCAKTRSALFEATGLKSFQLLPIAQTESCDNYIFILFLFMSATSCFYLVDLWHSDNEQARSVIGTAAGCPVEMHTSRLETVSLCLTTLHHLRLTLLRLPVLLLAHNAHARICICTHSLWVHARLTRAIWWWCWDGFLTDFVA